MTRYLLKHIFFYFLLLLYVNTSAQNWQNPANKYLDSYKAYLSAVCPIPQSNIQHFVYFAGNRSAVKGHPLLYHPTFKGAQIMYSWKNLEPEKGQYDFSKIEEDLAYLNKHGKSLFIQLQDVTFTAKNKPSPDYLATEYYADGMVVQIDESGNESGWATKRWNPNVQKEFAKLLKALGNKFNGKIAGINLQETAIETDKQNTPDFTGEAYITGLKANMLNLKRAFPNTTTMIYANFMPEEWLPFTDKGYLKEIYRYAEEIGLGLGAPDLMVTRKGQLNHALAQMHENNFSVPIGIAIQDGNYIGKTGADKDYNEDEDTGTERDNIVPLLFAFAKGFLKVNYMFWGHQEPYFTEDVLSCFK